MPTEKYTITGTDIAYLCICPRKLWLAKHGIQLESTHQNIQIGRQMHEESFSREQKEIPIGDWGFADWIDFSHQTLHENKKSRAPRKAHQWQTLFYLAKLNLLGIPIKKAVIHELQHRQTKQIELTEELNAQIETMENEATHIINQPMPPPPVTIVACKKCSFEEFCYA